MRAMTMTKTTNSGPATWRCLARDTRGTEIAEMAVVLPLLFMLLMGIFWFGQAFRVYGTLTQAARAGARAAVAPVCATCARLRNWPRPVCPNRGPERDGSRKSKHESVGASLSVDNASSGAVPVWQFRSWVRSSYLRRQRHHPDVCSEERSVVLSGTSECASGHGHLRHSGKYALQVSLPFQHSRYQPGPQYHSASRRGADESGDAMTEAQRQETTTMTKKRVATPRLLRLASTKARLERRAARPRSWSLLFRCLY